MIESMTNSKIKYINKLKQKKYRLEYKEFLVEGFHLVLEAYKTGNVMTIFTSIDVVFPGAEIIQVSTFIMKKISELNEENSIIAICKKPSFIDLSPKILILDQIQDPGNMGTLIRTAAAFGFNTIVSDNSVDYYNEKVIRSSQGALFYVNLIEENIEDFIKNNTDFHYYGTDVLQGKDLKDIDFKNKKIAVILGNEGNGVRDSIKKLVNTNIKIPMISTESLNVGIAGGIIMYESFRRDN